jgi:hypothetical protein
MTAAGATAGATQRPRLAAFPKAFMQALCKDGSMGVSEWIGLAAPLGLDGLEWYAGFLEMADARNWPRFRREVEAHDRAMMKEYIASRSKYHAIELQKVKIAQS